MHPGITNPSPRKPGAKRLFIDTRSPHVGRISPPYQAPKCDRPAHFEWKGKLFDVHGREIIPGEPLPPDEADPDQVMEEPLAMDGELVRPEQLLVKSQQGMPLETLRKLAGAHLGDKLHRTRQQIEHQLRDLIELTKAAKHPSSARLARARAAREAALDQEWFRGMPQASSVAETEVEDFHDA